MTKNKSAMPAADMQWRARKIAMQASKLADQAGPATKKVAVTARQQAGGAANWAKPRVGRVRAWMAVRASRGSMSVQDSLAPKVSAMLATAARKLDPPKPKSRRLPKVFAGTALLAAGAAAATAMAIRNRQRAMPPPVPKPANRAAGQPSSALNGGPNADRSKAETGANGMSRTR
jgi:hypothetical protein